MTFDVAILGGGIVGLATALRLLERRPGIRLVVLEKEAEVAAHQTGRNSGVLHAGVYYRPGSRKASFCRQGKREMEAFCESAGIPFRTCGKTIVAVSEEEVPRLEEIHRRAEANGVAVKRICPDRLREIEPHAAGVAALHVLETGVVDFASVAHCFEEKLRLAGADIRTNAGVLRGREDRTGIVAETTVSSVEAKILVNCTGLWADRVARLFGVTPSVQLIPFRGEYLELSESARHLCRGMIYPVPDPSFPFLGVHLTRTVDNRVEAGPSAVLAFAREGYRFGRVKPRELAEIVASIGFRELARKHWRTGFLEMRRSLSRRAFLHALQRLVPELTLNILKPAPAGVRAQAVFPDGSLADDFVIETTRRAVHVINAPSPAATASLAIGQHLAGLALERLE